VDDLTIFVQGGPPEIPPATMAAIAHADEPVAKKYLVSLFDAVDSGDSSQPPISLQDVVDSSDSSSQLPHRDPRISMSLPTSVSRSMSKK